MIHRPLTEMYAHRLIELTAILQFMRSGFEARSAGLDVTQAMIAAVDEEVADVLAQL